MDRETKVMELSGAGSADAVRPYDFRHPLRFSRDQVRAVGLVHERYASLVATTLSAHLRTQVQVTLAGVEQLPYEEFARSVSTPAILGVFPFASAESNALLEIQPDVAEAILDRMLGGQGKPSGRARELTAIETGLMSRVLSLALRDLGAAWRGLADVTPALETIATSLLSRQIASPGEVVLVVGLTLHLCGVNGRMRLCLPAAAVGPLLARVDAAAWLSPSGQSGAPGGTPEIGQHLGETAVGLRAVLGRATLPLGDLVTLEVGDVICLDTRPGQELLLYVEGEAKFLCQPGTSGKRNAVQITRLLQENPSIAPGA